MTEHGTEAAAAILWRNWNDETRIAQLPDDCRPDSRAAGYAIQAALGRLVDQPVFGWKIAATSQAGQQHIGVDGPIAGRLFAHRVLPAGAPVPLTPTTMKLAEAEFAFRMARALPRREQPYELAEIVAAIETLHPAIEIPGSRYTEVARAGAAQLIADDACASWFILGEPATENWRELDLVSHQVRATRNGEAAGAGSGANVLGSPLLAMTWIANELRLHADGLRAGDVITTGTCLPPVPLAPGDHIRMDFGILGALEARFSA
ncbi:MAG: 2-keto-4-pentenoate hydratase [Blastocatellia bacterium]